MNSGRTVFSQIMDFLSEHEFDRCVRRYGGGRRIRRFSCKRQFYAMAFAQLTRRDGLRDIEACLRAVPGRLYHMGLGGPVPKSTLADANERRDWRIYADLARALLLSARELYVGEELCVELGQAVYALDSTTIDLCLALFPWAPFQQSKAAVKLHTQLDLRGSLPAFLLVTDGKVHDVNFLDHVAPEPGAIYVMDRAYTDFGRLYRLHLAKAVFVTRAKRNLRWRRVSSRSGPRGDGVLGDQVVRLCGKPTLAAFPERLRRVRFYDAQSRRTFIFLTNDLLRPPEVIAALYRSRWKIEVFFRWIKQNLRIKAFYGTSENAVKTQIWIAVSVYALAAIAKKRLGVAMSLHTMLQVISLSAFEKVPLIELLSEIELLKNDGDNSNPLLPFDF